MSKFSFKFTNIVLNCHECCTVERQADTTNQQGVLTHNGRPSRITTIYCRSKAMTSNQYTVCLQVVPIITNVLTIVHYLWYTVQQFIGMYIYVASGSKFQRILSTVLHILLQKMWICTGRWFRCWFLLFTIILYQNLLQIQFISLTNHFLFF